MVKRFLLMAAMLSAVGATADAASTNFGDFIADDVMFLQVFEDNLEPNLLYDVTGTTGNTLNIEPQNFGLEIDPNPGDSVPQSDVIDSTLRMTIMTKDGFSINEINVTEDGDFNTFGSGAVDVFVPYFWDIIGVDGNLASISGQGVAPMVTNGPLWSVDLSINLAQALADEGLSGDITKVKFNFDNNLSASVLDDGSFAFIKKKRLGGVTVSVPEPGNMMPLLIGMLALLGIRRR